MKQLTKLSLAAGAALALLLGTTQVQARDLAVVNYGGANGEAQNAAFNRPYEKATGKTLNVVQYNGEQAKVKAMVEAGNVVWDVLDIETGDLGRGCDEGLYEDIDWTEILDPDDLIEGTLRHCGVGIFVWSTVLGYNTAKLDHPPSSWQDFWDVEKYPGKRGMRKGAHYNLEFALMADGVPVDEVYDTLRSPEGVERAFKKLDEIKPHIQWWEAGAQPPQMLAAGDVIMSTVYNGRIDAAQKEGEPLDIMWDGGVYDFDYWVVTAGSPNKEQAIEYVKFASAPEQQANYTRNIAYGPVSKKAIDMLEDEFLAKVPNSPQNAEHALFNDLEFWTDNGEELEQRFTAWAAR